MLGGEQSGHIEAIGFELTLKCSNAAVREMKGKPLPKKPKPSSISASTSAFPRITCPKKTSACKCTNASPASKQNRN